MRQWTDFIKNITMLSQFSLSFITPTLLCLGICWWLCNQFGLGGWVYIPGFFFGLGGSFTVAYKLYLSVTNREEKSKKDKKEKIYFNRHS